jgi:predicted acetyltransferase
VSTEPNPTRVPPDDLLAFAKAVARHFHEDDRDEEVRLWADAFTDRYRAWWVQDPGTGRAVGNLGVIETDLSVAGGTRLPLAAVTAVGVAQTRRRRGLLRALMSAALDEAVEREEPVAALFASETAIYGRFGFGVGAPTVGYRIERARVRFHAPVDVRLVEEATPEEAAASWPAIHEALRDRRGGMTGSTPEMWRLAVREDPPSWWGGASPRRLVHVPGRGYARYRIKGAPDDPFPAGEVQLAELVATDPEAEAALWQHVCDVDLTTTVDAHVRPPDDALPELVIDRLALHPRQGPPFYVRVLDVARCLEARRYATEGTTVLEVADPEGRAGGRYRLDAGPEGATCRPTDDEPDVVLPVTVLPGVWLGGIRATTLAAARRLEERRPGAAATLDRLMLVDHAPWTNVIF